MSDITGAIVQVEPDIKGQRDNLDVGVKWSSLSRLLRLLPPEVAQQIAVRFLRTSRRVSELRGRSFQGLSSFFFDAGPTDERLSISAFGYHFPNPIGQAAGFDKDATIRDAIFELGFGFAECGTVTPLPQPGNPSPRLFRLVEDEAVINRMGFNNEGIEKVAKRLSKRQRRGIIGINIGANKDSEDRIRDYILTFSKVSNFVEYVTINVSSPNTPGLRGLQNPDDLAQLLRALTEAREKLHSKIPLILKIAPDLSEKNLDDIARVSLSSGIEGIIATNTTIARPSNLKSLNASETGGLSGAPLFGPSTAILKSLRQRVGDKLVLIGAGGVRSGADAYAKIRAGASLVQLYTALAYEGPTLVARVKSELLTLLTRDGYANVKDAVGADVR